MLRWLCICVASFYLYCKGEATNIRLFPAKEVLYVTQGNNVTLTCIATELNGKTVRWDHSGKQIANVASETVVYSDPADQEKYVVESGKHGDGNFSFTLLRYSARDAGSITCDVAGVNPVTVRLETLVLPDTFSLEVLSRYREVDWSNTEKGIVLDLRENVVFSCTSINGRPLAIIKWIWDGNVTDQSWSNSTTYSETNGELYNVTSTIVLPSRYFRQSLVSSENTVISTPYVNKSAQNGTGFNVDGSLDTIEVSKMKTTSSKSYGKLSCVATIGDKVFVRSRMILFTDFTNSGIQALPTFWNWNIVILCAIIGFFRL